MFPSLIVVGSSVLVKLMIGVKETMFNRHITEEFGVKIFGPSTIYTDNKAAYDLMTMAPTRSTATPPSARSSASAATSPPSPSTSSCRRASCGSLSRRRATLASAVPVETGELRLKFYPKTIRGAKKSEVVEASCGVPRFVLTFSTSYSFL